MQSKNRWALFAGPVFALVIGVWFAIGVELPWPAVWCAGITSLCAFWWVFEPIPMPVTAVIPFAAFPLAGILTHQEVGANYGHTLVLLMLAGSIVSKGLEKSGAHRRIALGMVRLVGGPGGRRLVLGFLLASAVLSMWMSNTATVLMLLPVALAVLEGADNNNSLTIPLLLAVAYGASIGGSGTPIGTPPNLIFLDTYHQLLESQPGGGKEMTFAGWMSIGVPMVVVLVPVAWFWLIRGIKSGQRVELPRLGPWRPAERRVLAVFAVLAFAWLTRTQPSGGWSQLLARLVPGADQTVGDSTVALVAVVMMFLIPSGERPGQRLLDWETAIKIPWGVFIMIGGGLTIGQAFETSGLREYLGDSLSMLVSLPQVLTVFLLCLMATFLTEITSNTAVSTILLPVLGAAAVKAGIDPLLLMVPATLGLNCSFMLPVATAPNAIVFGTGQVPVARMAREGLVLNVLGTCTITMMTLWLLRG